jgi:hypothetical protein
MRKVIFATIPVVFLIVMYFLDWNLSRAVGAGAISLGVAILLATVYGITYWNRRK